MNFLVPGILAMAAVVLASNILVQFLLGDWLTWGAFTYPLAFLVTDLVNLVYGPKAARKVVWVGFVVGVLCSLIGSQIAGPTGPLVSWRIAVASGTAFLVGQLLDVYVFNRLRQGRWWRAPLWSTLTSSSIDTILFFSIAFSASMAWLEPTNDVRWASEMLPLLGLGPTAPHWVSLAVADWSIKLSLALITLVPFRVAVRRLTAQFS